jgi:hypothetical protein
VKGREDLQQLTGHLDADLLLLGVQQMGHTSQVPNLEVK